MCKWSGNCAQHARFQVYDGLDADVKLNDIVEFIGILTFDPELTVHRETVGENSDVQAAFMEEDISAHLPASRVMEPQLHESAILLTIMIACA